MEKNSTKISNEKIKIIEENQNKELNNLKGELEILKNSQVQFGNVETEAEKKVYENVILQLKTQVADLKEIINLRQDEITYLNNLIENKSKEENMTKEFNTLQKLQRGNFDLKTINETLRKKINVFN